MPSRSRGGSPRAGALLTLFTSRYEDAPPYDWSNGYLVVREGGRFGVYRAAARHLRRYGHRYDAVVDFQNGIPFFAPLWAPASTAVICVVHHVHQAQFDMYFRWPLNHVGRLLEGRATRRVYRGRLFVAVSPSTRAEMRRQLGLREPVQIVPNGIASLPLSRPPRSPSPAIAVVTRLTAAQAAASSRASSARPGAPLARPPRGHCRNRACPRQPAGTSPAARAGTGRDPARPSIGAGQERPAQPGVADRCALAC